eukprot:scaffold1_cov402-Prasinococcus_capsulatus_cf.AAC.22
MAALPSRLAAVHRHLPMQGAVLVAAQARTHIPWRLVLLCELPARPAPGCPGLSSRGVLRCEGIAPAGRGRRARSARAASWGPLVPEGSRLCCWGRRGRPYGT